jgi:hypothetical protein
MRLITHIAGAIRSIITIDNRARSMKPLSTRKLVYLAIAVIALAAVRTNAQQQGRVKIDVSKLGPQVGDKVPDFSLPDQTGTVKTLQSIMGPKGAMLLFIRSADW